MTGTRAHTSLTPDRPLGPAAGTLRVGSARHAWSGLRLVEQQGDGQACAARASEQTFLWRMAHGKYLGTMPCIWHFANKLICVGHSLNCSTFTAFDSHHNWVFWKHHVVDRSFKSGLCRLQDHLGNVFVDAGHGSSFPEILCKCLRFLRQGGCLSIANDNMTAYGCLILHTRRMWQLRLLFKQGSVKLSGVFLVLTS